MIVHHTTVWLCRVYGVADIHDTQTTALFWEKQNWYHMCNQWGAQANASRYKTTGQPSHITAQKLENSQTPSNYQHKHCIQKHKYNIAIYKTKDNKNWDYKLSKIYKLTCNTCKISYIGQTSRSLNRRYWEHTHSIYYKVYTNTDLSQTLCP
jgi:hypothetical protein